MAWGSWLGFDLICDFLSAKNAAMRWLAARKSDGTWPERALDGWSVVEERKPVEYGGESLGWLSNKSIT